MKVYADAVMILNFLVDFLLILGTNRLSGNMRGSVRALLGASLGAIYSGLCLFPNLCFLNNTMWRVAILFCMSLIAFGWNSCTIRRMVTFVLLSMTLGGLALGIGDGSFLVTIVCCVCLYLVIYFGVLKYPNKRFVTVELEYQGRTRKITALWDTGNMLTDPISGEPVLIVGADIAMDMLRISPEQLKDPITSLPALGISGLRLLSYRGIGQPGGMLLALKVDNVYINGRKSGPLVAFAPESIGSGDFQALLGGVI